MVEIKFDTDTDIFSKYSKGECIRIIQAIEKEIDNRLWDSNQFKGKIFDINGNEIGKYKCDLS